jgi:hypothetical protein
MGIHEAEFIGETETILEAYQLQIVNKPYSGFRHEDFQQTNSIISFSLLGKEKKKKGKILI